VQASNHLQRTLKGPSNLGFSASMGLKAAERKTRCTAGEV
jgi:hypothetical protein